VQILDRKTVLGEEVGKPVHSKAHVALGERLEEHEGPSPGASGPG